MWNEMETFVFNPFGNDSIKKKSSKQSKNKNSSSRKHLKLKEETPLDILLISGHGVLMDETFNVPSNSVYLYDSHAGFSSNGSAIERMFFKKKIPVNATYLSSWVLNTTADKLGNVENILVKRPGEKYNNSDLSLLLDFRSIDDTQEFLNIDECDIIYIQKSGIYSYDTIKTLDTDYKVSMMVVLKLIYIDEEYKITELNYDRDDKSYSKSRKLLYEKEPNAKPFYIISKEQIQHIFENSIYPTVEEVELLFGNESEVSYKKFYKKFKKKFNITVDKCFEKFHACILLIPSCRENNEIDETRLGEIQDDSYNNWQSRYELSPTFSFSSHGSKGSTRSSTSARSSRNSRSSNKKSNT